MSNIFFSYLFFFAVLCCSVGVLCAFVCWTGRQTVRPRASVGRFGQHRLRRVAIEQAAQQRRRRTLQGVCVWVSVVVVMWSALVLDVLSTWHAFSVFARSTTGTVFNPIRFAFHSVDKLRTLRSGPPVRTMLRTIVRYECDRTVNVVLYTGSVFRWACVYVCACSLVVRCVDSRH